MKRSAFTMIELVMVIVVLGILAALAIPRLDSDIRQRSGDNILSAIRFTQQMALMDDVTDPRHSDWQRTFWRLEPKDNDLPIARRYNRHQA
jgi:prepilin-type N-terminal cleavage/methylation domain-containing protein